jgi:hypothetical protein
MDPPNSKGESDVIFNPIHVTLHSDITYSHTNGSIDKTSITYNPDAPPSQLNTYDDYLGTINNYVYQKVYVLPPDKQEINFWFYDTNGRKYSIIQINRYEVDQEELAKINEELEQAGLSPLEIQSTFYCEQTLYKIECELIIQR